MSTRQGSVVEVSCGEATSDPNIDRPYSTSTINQLNQSPNQSMSIVSQSMHDLNQAINQFSLNHHQIKLIVDS